LKGKRQRSRQHRHDQAQAAELDRLRIEITAEADRLDNGRRNADLVKVAEDRLAREQAATHRRLKPHERLAAHLSAHAVQQLNTIAAARQEVDAAAASLLRTPDDRAIRRTAQSGQKLRYTRVHRSADDRYVAAWYRKTFGPDPVINWTISLEGWVPADIPDDKAALKPYATATASDVHAEACWTWAIPPWLRIPTGSDTPALRTQLGAVTGGIPKLRNEALPPSHRRFNTTITTPWRHAPLVQVPTDVADIAHWYHRSAWSQGWRDDIGVPFWLPAEYATSYPQARSLPTGTDLRLPYPMVFVAFAEPWRINPIASELSNSLAANHLGMFYARGQAASHRPEPLCDVLGRLQATGRTDRDTLPTPLEALDGFGGSVEGLLLTAGPDGTPGDDFAWCIAVLHPSGFPIARITVPASRNACGWRNQVDNIIAGIALSCWHEPAGRSAGSETSTAAMSQVADPDGNLHVLDIDATSPPGDSVGGSTGRTIRPHLRRGHWRRHADRRAGHTRWIWVRPTAVNGGAATSNQVYVLPDRLRSAPQP
jgi:hypothetical protein